MRRFGAFAAALGGLVASGCSFPADYDGTRYQCQPGDECPPGFACTAGYCESVSPGDPDGGDDDSDDGGGSRSDAGDGPPGQDANDPADADPSACSAASSFADDFTSDENWDVLGNGAGCNIQFIDGQIELSSILLVPAGECAARSRTLYLLDDRTWIEAVSPGFGDPAATFGVDVDGQVLLIRRDQDGLTFLEREGDEEQTLNGVKFNPDEHRFWGLRAVEPDDMFFETSPDGVEWFTEAEFRPRADPTSTCVRYEISLDDTATSSSTVAFDNLNRLP